MATPTPPRIGDFSRPPVDVPAPASAPVSTASPTKEKLDAVEQRLKTEASEAEAQLAPLEAYEKQLKEVGLTREEAARIVDDVLTKGYYEETFPITSRVKVTFRTRLARDIRRVHERLEADRYTIDSHYSMALSRYLLAASLSSFGTTKFAFPQGVTEETEKAYQARLEFVDGLSEPALQTIYPRLAKFDRKVAVAFQEGAIENF